MMHPIGSRNSGVESWIIGRSGLGQFMKLMMFSGMDTFVLLQILRSLESFAAYLTRMWFEGSMNYIVSCVLRNAVSYIPRR
jgi:hypothetical protein